MRCDGVWRDWDRRLARVAMLAAARQKKVLRMDVRLVTIGWMIAVQDGVV